MNKFLTCTLALTSLFFATSCSDNKSTTETTTTNPSTTPTTTATAADSTAAPASTATQYTCPMHPEVITSKPGQCPKCGMDLVVKK